MPRSQSHVNNSSYTKALVLVSLIIVAFSLVSCGSSDSSSSVVETQTGQTDTDTDKSSALTTSDNAAPSIVTQEELVPRNSWWTFNVSLSQGDRFEITYTSKSFVPGSHRESGNNAESGIVFAVSNPSGESIHRGEKEVSGELSFTADLSGDYEITFLNPFKRQIISVSVEYKVNP